MDTLPQPTIALLPWGNVIEDFLDSIGISFDKFCDEMTGGWMFGYIEALKLAGVRTVLVCISANVQAPMQRIHRPTGCTVYVLPASKFYLAINHYMLNPYGWTVKDVFGKKGKLTTFGLSVFRDVAPYLATPVHHLKQILQQESCQAILCQEYEYARFDWCVLLGRMMNLPVYATFQGGNFQLSRFERFIRPASIRSCQGLIVASQVEVQRVQAQYSPAPSKIAQIFNPLDLKMWEGGDRLSIRALLNISPEAKVVVWHGRVDMYRKGLDILITAWKQICAKHPNQDLWLLLIGTGQDADRLKQQIQDLEVPRVQWVNEYLLDRQRIRDYLTAADIYTLPSRHEGFAVAPLEAMACGLPIVATDAPGIADILATGESSGGLMVPRENVVALAEGIDRLLQHEDFRHELGQQAKQRVEVAFSLKAVGQQLHTFLIQDRK